MLEWRSLRASLARCPLCGPSVVVRLSASPIGARCLRCAASGITMALVSVLREEVGSLGGLHVYELSSRGPLVDWLRRHAGRPTCSEWFDGASPGHGFAELRRVLRPGGRLVFSVPLSPAAPTIERARLLKDGEVEHLLPPEYHGDRIRGRGRVLAYRNYGFDVLERVAAQGFRDVRFARSAPEIAPWAPPIVVATV